MERRRKEQMRGEEMVERRGERLERGGEGWRGERGTEERMERMRGGREEDRESRTGP